MPAVGDAGFSIKGTLTKEQQEFIDNLKNNTKNKEKLENQKMGKDQFMKILLTQLANQNPLEPLQDKDFIAQMAQFSTLEEARGTNEALTNLSKEVTEIKKALDTNKGSSEAMTSLSKDVADIKKTLDEIKAKTAYQP